MTTTVLHRHGWGGKVGAEPMAATGWAANPGLCGPWKDLQAEGQAPGVRGRGMGLPDGQVCKPLSVTAQRSHSTIEPRDTQVFQQQARLVHCKQRTSPANSDQQVGPCGGLREAGRPEGAAPSCPRDSGKEDQSWLGPLPGQRARQGWVGLQRGLG